MIESVRQKWITLGKERERERQRKRTKKSKDKDEKRKDNLEKTSNEKSVK